jgi:hypothetical protein
LIPFKLATGFFALLSLIALLMKFRKMKLPIWIFMIQQGCALGIILKTYHLYGFGLSLLATAITVLGIYLTSSVFNEIEPQLKSESLPSIPIRKKVEPANIKMKITDKQLNSYFYHDSTHYRHGYYCYLPLIPASNDKERSAYNQSLLLELHQITEQFSQLGGAIVSEENFNHSFINGLFAFFDTQKKIKGMQSGNLSIMFADTCFTAIRVIEHTCRGAEWYELAIETQTKRIFISRPSDNLFNSSIQIYNFAINLAAVWKIPVYSNHINEN